MKTSNQNPMLAKAWVNFNGTGTIAIRDSFNVTSLTDHASGICTVNLSVTMADTNYAVIGGVSGTTSGYGYTVWEYDSGSAKTTTAVKLGVAYTNSATESLYAASIICVTLFGDVA